jgi:hypothetical protein
LKMFNKLEARVLSEYKRSRAAPSTFCTLIKHYFSFIKHYVKHHCPYNKHYYLTQLFIYIVCKRHLDREHISSLRSCVWFSLKTPNPKVMGFLRVSLVSSHRECWRCGLGLATKTDPYIVDVLRGETWVIRWLSRRALRSCVFAASKDD